MTGDFVIGDLGSSEEEGLHAPLFLASSASSSAASLCTSVEEGLHLRPSSSHCRFVPRRERDRPSQCSSDKTVDFGTFPNVMNPPPPPQKKRSILAPLTFPIVKNNAVKHKSTKKSVFFLKKKAQRKIGAEIDRLSGERGVQI